MELPYKAIDQKWTVWDCPDKLFSHNHEFFRFAIELPAYNKEVKNIMLKVRPSYTLSKKKLAQFACVYEMEYEVLLHESIFTDSILYDLIINDCYPAFVEAFNKQKAEFPNVHHVPAPELSTEVFKVVKEGSVQALKDAGYP